MKIILAFLQNQYFKDPEKVKAMLEENPEKRNWYIEKFLFMGCKTGKVLLQTLGPDITSQIIWEEVSKEIGSYASSVFPADEAHILESIALHNPDIIIGFGKIAEDALKKLKTEEKIDLSKSIFYAPHPAARQDRVIPDLRRLRHRIELIV